MKSKVAAAIASAGILFAMPAGALASGFTTTPSQITPTAPSRLTTTSATVTATSTAPAAHPTPLPNTGYDLLPETLIGLALVGAGVGMKVRRSRS